MLLPFEGRRLYYDLTGPEDGPVVLMTHSLMSDSGMWSEQMPALLQAGYRVLRLDMRGHGGSDPVAGDYTMQELADDWAGALEGLRIPRVHYIGLSIGGQSGQAFAIEHSAKLISTMLCACAPSSGTVGDDIATWNRGRDAVRKANSVEPLADEIMEHFLSDATKRRKPGRWKQIRDTVAATTPAGMLGGAAAIMNYDFTAQLPSIKVPTLAVRGAQDPDGTAKAMRRLAELVPGARYEEVPDARHFCNVDQPDTFNRIMMDWLDKQRKLT
jgi:3-oxoadipate enol-lactonase